MNTLRKIALTSILSGTVAIATTTATAADSGLSSSTDWQTWNQYVSTPTQQQSSGIPTGVPASTNWQAWNRYMGDSSKAQYKFTQSSLPSSTNWQGWNTYIATTNN